MSVLTQQGAYWLNLYDSTDTLGTLLEVIATLTAKRVTPPRDNVPTDQQGANHEPELGHDEG